MDYKDLPPEIKQLYRTAQKNSAIRGIPFDLTNDEFATVWERSHGKCTVTGLEFDLRKAKVFNQRRPFFPSLDRLDSSIGYTYDNCRFVCIAVNYAMNQWGENVFLKICEAVIGRRYAPHRKMPKGVKAISRKTKDGSVSVTYKARIRIKNKEVNLGFFDNPEEAAAAYKKAKKKIFGPRLDPEVPNPLI